MGGQNPGRPGIHLRHCRGEGMILVAAAFGETHGEVPAPTAVSSAGKLDAKSYEQVLHDARGAQPAVRHLIDALV